MQSPSWQSQRRITASFIFAESRGIATVFSAAPMTAGSASGADRGARTGAAQASCAPSFGGTGASAGAETLPPASPITQKVFPTGTRSPGSADTWVSTPVADAFSVCTSLSVSISTRGSPSVTASPFFLCHSTITPSSMVIVI